MQELKKLTSRFGRLADPLSNALDMFSFDLVYIVAEYALEQVFIAFHDKEAKYQVGVYIPLNGTNGFVETHLLAESKFRLCLYDPALPAMKHTNVEIQQERVVKEIRVMTNIFFADKAQTRTFLLLSRGENVHDYTKCTPEITDTMPMAVSFALTEHEAVDAAQRERCVRCMKPSQMECNLCHMISYCSAACMEKDSKRHQKQSCALYQSLKRTRNFIRDNHDGMAVADLYAAISDKFLQDVIRRGDELLHMFGGGLRPPYPDGGVPPPYPLPDGKE